MENITDIQNEMLTEKAKHQELDVLNSTSKVAVWRLFFYIVSYAIFNFKLLLDEHKAEIETKIREEKAHTPRWYRNMALSFQYGFDLYVDTDRFNNEGYTEDQIEQSKIIKYSAVTESQNQSRLIVKIAGETSGVLSPISEAEKESFIAYMEEIRDAGVAITVINYLPDLLSMNITIKRDALVLDAQGYAIAPINGNLRPIDKAIKDFLRNLPFNGELVVDDLETSIKQVPGVLDISIDSASSSWIDPAVNDYGSLVGMYMSKIPESGYFTTQDKNGTDLITITYVV